MENVSLTQKLKAFGAMLFDPDLAGLSCESPGLYLFTMPSQLLAQRRAVQTSGDISHVHA